MNKAKHFSSLMISHFLFLPIKCLLITAGILCLLLNVSWAQKNELGVRNAHAMIYDQGSKQVLLFGGADEQQVHGDLWRFSGKKWKKLKANGPAARTFPAIAYDEKNERVLLFGGSKVLFGQETSAQNLLDDTWEFKNKRWRQLITTNAPVPRAESSMVYDPAHQKVYLFGGYTIEGENYIKLGDTWELVGDQWKKLTDEGPSARHGVVLTYDKNSRRVLLFGGSTVDRDYGDQTGESWTFDGKSWTKLTENQPPNIFNAAFAHSGEQLIRFGGWNGNGRISETWQFSQSRWSSINTTQSPSARNHSAMVWDEKNDRFILYGGHDGENVFGDTWSFEKGKWKLLIDQAALKRMANGH